jgi:hypothetical protein
MQHVIFGHGTKSQTDGYGDGFPSRQEQVALNNAETPEVWG